MSATNAKVQSVIENTFILAIEKLKQADSGNLISDMYAQADRESGELQLFDDSENLLEKIVIFDWIGSKETDEAFNKHVASTLKAVLTTISNNRTFDHPLFLKPLSISLTDEDFMVIEELLFLDDDFYRLDDPLLKDLDSELDDFLANLLSDVE